MKTNGLRNKKPAMARAAWRCAPLLGIWVDAEMFGYGPGDTWVHRWHRAAKGRK